MNIVAADNSIDLSGWHDGWRKGEKSSKVKLPQFIVREKNYRLFKKNIFGGNKKERTSSFNSLFTMRLNQVGT